MSAVSQIHPVKSHCGADTTCEITLWCGLRLGLRRLIALDMTGRQPERAIPTLMSVNFCI